VAKPIALEIAPRDPKAELAEELQTAPLEHAEALLAGLKLLQALHDRGVLELLRGAVQGGDKTVTAVADALNTPEAIRGVRNVMVFSRVMCSIDPALMDKFAAAVPEALTSAAQAEQEEPPGFIGVLRIFKSKDLRRGLAVVNGLLKAWGKNFSAKTEG